jgi:SAM-dependent methyltransferase
VNAAEDKWAARYGGDEYFYGTEPNDFLREQAGRLKPGAKVLCLAEGEGRNAVFLAGRGCAVTGVDQSAAGLEKTRRLAKERGVTVETVRADLADYDLGTARWDGIVSIWAHVPPALRRSLYARGAAALKPGGVLILEAYTPDQLRHKTGGPPDPALTPRLADLREELAGLRLEIGRELERDVREGRGHGGLSAVVQVVAVKDAA